jgi:hypothetical protein
LVGKGDIVERDRAILHDPIAQLGPAARPLVLVQEGG